MDLEANVPMREAREVFENPFPLMEVGESFSVPLSQYNTWQVRSRYWQAKLSLSGKKVNLRFTWQKERNDDGTPKGTARCWRVA